MLILHLGFYLSAAESTLTSQDKYFYIGFDREPLTQIHDSIYCSYEESIRRKIKEFKGKCHDNLSCAIVNLANSVKVENEIRGLLDSIFEDDKNVFFGDIYKTFKEELKSKLIRKIRCLIGLKDLEGMFVNDEIVFMILSLIEVNLELGCLSVIECKYKFKELETVSDIIMNNEEHFKFGDDERILDPEDEEDIKHLKEFLDKNITYYGIPVKTFNDEEKFIDTLLVLLKSALNVERAGKSFIFLDFNGQLPFLDYVLSRKNKHNGDFKANDLITNIKHNNDMMKKRNMKVHKKVQVKELVYKEFNKMFWINKIPCHYLSSYWSYIFTTLLTNKSPLKKPDYPEICHHLKELNLLIIEYFEKLIFYSSINKNDMRGDEDTRSIRSIRSAMSSIVVKDSNPGLIDPNQSSAENK